MIWKWLLRFAPYSPGTLHFISLDSPVSQSRQYLSASVVSRVSPGSWYPWLSVCNVSDSSSGSSGASYPASHWAMSHKKPSDWQTLTDIHNTTNISVPLWGCGSNFHQSEHFLKNHLIRSEPSLVSSQAGHWRWLTPGLLGLDIDIWSGNLVIFNISDIHHFTKFDALSPISRCDAPSPRARALELLSGRGPGLYFSTAFPSKSGSLILL